MRSGAGGRGRDSTHRSPHLSPSSHTRISIEKWVIVHGQSVMKSYSCSTYTSRRSVKSWPSQVWPYRHVCKCWIVTVQVTCVLLYIKKGSVSCVASSFWCFEIFWQVAGRDLGCGYWWDRFLQTIATVVKMWAKIPRIYRGISSSPRNTFEIGKGILLPVEISSRSKCQQSPKHLIRHCNAFPLLLNLSVLLLCYESME